MCGGVSLLLVVRLAVHQIYSLSLLHPAQKEVEYDSLAWWYVVVVALAVLEVVGLWFV